MKKSNAGKKLTLIAGVILGLVIILVGASILQSSDFQFGSNRDTAERNDEPDPTSELEETEPDPFLPHMSIGELYEILNDESGEGFFVYVGRDTCPACQLLEPTLREVLEDLDQSLRYFEVDRLWETEDNYTITIPELLEILDVQSVPTLVYIQNGEAIDWRLARDLSGDDTAEVLLEFFEEHGGLN